MAESEAKPLKVLIVGAGIGGLAAGLALRQQGHKVTLFEASKFSKEIGAAINVTPNCNGLLKRLGIRLEDYGGIPCNSFAIYDAKGHKVHTINTRATAGKWQHDWFFIHRAGLHKALKDHAVGQGKGEPCILNLDSRIQNIDPENAKLSVNGEIFQGDIIIGADGVHSEARKALSGGRGLIPFDFGYSMFRWLVPSEILRADPMTEPLIGPPGTLSICINGEMRLIFYPCNDNTVMNCGLVYPSNLTPQVEGDWNTKGSKDLLLNVGRSFSANAVAFMSKAPEDGLRLWPLLDLPILHTWTEGRLALLGDAAHPFLPHQAQGGSQAIEDAMSLAAMFPLGTTPDEISERLQLYVKIRKPRADHVQQSTRNSAKYIVPPEDTLHFLEFNFSHDEWHNSTVALDRYQQSKQSYRYRQPYEFGPAPGPLQPLNEISYNPSDEYRIERSIRFKSSRTFLQRLLPPSFKFASAATLIQASMSINSLRNLKWLSGRGYDSFALDIHGVTYTKKSGEVLYGSFRALLFENSADSIITGHDELGAPKHFADIDIREDENSTSVNLSWKGARFGQFTLPNNKTVVEDLPKPQPDNGFFMWRYIPAVGRPGKADIEYPIFDPILDPIQLQPAPTNGFSGSESIPTSNGTNGAPANEACLAETNDTNGFAKSILPLADSTVVNNHSNDSTSSIASISFDALDWNQLPTLHHIAATLADVPVYGIVESNVERINGVPNLASIYRIV